MGIMASPQTGAQFRRTAESVAEKVAELLRAPVIVTNADGTPVATSAPAAGAGEMSRLIAAQVSSGEVPAYLRVPLRLGDAAGEVLVGDVQDEEPVSPRLAQALIEMVVNDVAVVDRLLKPLEDIACSGLRLPFSHSMTPFCRRTPTRAGAGPGGGRRR